MMYFSRSGDAMTHVVEETAAPVGAIDLFDAAFGAAARGADGQVRVRDASGRWEVHDAMSAICGGPERPVVASEGFVVTTCWEGKISAIQFASPRDWPPPPPRTLPATMT